MVWRLYDGVRFVIKRLKIVNTDFYIFGVGIGYRYRKRLEIKDDTDSDV